MIPYTIHLPEDGMTTKDVFERLVSDPKQLECEVVCAHRLGFHGSTEGMSAEKIAYADEILERYVARERAKAVAEEFARWSAAVSAVDKSPAVTWSGRGGARGVLWAALKATS